MSHKMSIYLVVLLGVVGLSFGGAERQGSGDSCCLGDLDKDGSIDVADLSAAVNMLLTKGSPFVIPDQAGSCADMNQDKQVDLEDLWALAAILLQPESPFASKCE